MSQLVIFGSTPLVHPTQPLLTRLKQSPIRAALAVLGLASAGVAIKQSPHLQNYCVTFLQTALNASQAVAALGLRCLTAMAHRPFTSLVLMATISAVSAIMYVKQQMREFDHLQPDNSNIGRCSQPFSTIFNCITQLKPQETLGLIPPDTISKVAARLFGSYKQLRLRTDYELMRRLYHELVYARLNDVDRKSCLALCKQKQFSEEMETFINHALEEPINFSRLQQDLIEYHNNHLHELSLWGAPNPFQGPFGRSTLHALTELTVAFDQKTINETYYLRGSIQMIEMAFKHATTLEQAGAIKVALDELTAKHKVKLLSNTFTMICSTSFAPGAPYTSTQQSFRLTIANLYLALHSLYEKHKTVSTAQSAANCLAKAAEFITREDLSNDRYSKWQTYAVLLLKMKVDPRVDDCRIESFFNKLFNDPSYAHLQSKELFIALGDYYFDREIVEKGLFRDTVIKCPNHLYAGQCYQAIKEKYGDFGGRDLRYKECCHIEPALLLANPAARNSFLNMKWLLKTEDWPKAIKEAENLAALDITHIHAAEWLPIAEYFVKQLPPFDKFPDFKWDENSYTLCMKAMRFYSLALRQQKPGFTVDAEKAASISKFCDHACYYLVRGYLHPKGKLEAAERLIKLSLKHNSDCTLNNYRLALILLDQARCPDVDVIDSLEDLTRKNQLEQGWIGQIKGYIENSPMAAAKLKEALQAIDRAISRTDESEKADFAAFLFLKGEILQLLDGSVMNAPAADCYQKAYALEPTNPFYAFVCAESLGSATADLMRTVTEVQVQTEEIRRVPFEKNLKNLFKSHKIPIPSLELGQDPMGCEFLHTNNDKGYRALQFWYALRFYQKRIKESDLQRGVYYRPLWEVQMEAIKVEPSSPSLLWRLIGW